LKGYDDEFEDDYSKMQPIINQIEKFAQENEIVLEAGWKVELSKSVKVSMQKSKIVVNDSTLEKWIKLFNDFLK